MLFHVNYCILSKKDGKLSKLNFKNTCVITIIIALLLSGGSFFNYISWWSLSGLLLVFTVVLFIGSYNVCSNFYLNIFCKSKNRDNKIAITFDDGPDKENTRRIIEILKNFDAKATFFIIGKKAKENHQIIKDIIKQGHSLGNHTYSHSPIFDFYRTSKVISELEKTNNILKEITGKQIKYFRPPYGVTNPNIAKAVNKLKLTTIGWSIRSLDTIKKKETVKKRIEKVKSGDIILFHDTKKLTVEILYEFLCLCKRKKLEIVTIEELMKNTTNEK